MVCGILQPRGPVVSPENLIELAHRMRPGGVLKVPVYYLVKLRGCISYRSQTSPVALSPLGEGFNKEIIVQ